MTIKDVLTNPDQLIYIFSWLKNEKDLCEASKVCKTWNQVSQHNSLWQPIFNHFFEGRNCSSEPGAVKKCFGNIVESQKKLSWELVNKVLTTPDQLIYIFSWLDEKELCNVIPNVCKVWNEVSQHNSLWRPIFRRFYEGRNCSSEPGAIKRKFASLQMIRHDFQKLVSQDLKHRSFKSTQHEIRQIEYIDNWFFTIEMSKGSVNGIPMLPTFHLKIFNPEGALNTHHYLSNNFLKQIHIMKSQASILQNPVELKLKENTHGELKIVDEYCCLISKNDRTIYVTMPDNSKRELVHTDKLISYPQESWELVDCLIHIPDSTILVSACIHNVENVESSSATCILFWNLATGKCFDKIYLDDFGAITCSFQFFKEHLIIASGISVLIRDISQFYDDRYDERNVDDEQVDSMLTAIKVTDDAIIAGGDEGTVHIWEFPKKSTKEKMDIVFRENTKKHPRDENQEDDVSPKKAKIDN